MTKTIERAHYQVTFAVLVTGVSAYALLQSLVIPALSTIGHDLHTTQITWVVTAYLLSASVFTPIMGRVGDMIGKERVLVATLVALSAGSLIAGLAHSLGVLIIGRAVQGIGGGTLPLSFGIIRDEFPRAKVPTAIGTIAAMTAVGGGLGTIIAGPIVSSLGYHWLFFLPMIVTIVAAVATFFFVPESPVRTPGRVSWMSALLLSGWLVTLLVAVSEASSWGWGSARIMGLFALTVVVFVLWILSESRASEPLIDLAMMRVPAVWTNNLVGFLFGVGMYSAMAFLPAFLQTPASYGYGFGASIIRSGLFLLPMTVMMFFFGLLSGRIAARIGSKNAVIIGSIMSALGYITLAVAHSHPWQIYAVSALLGVGLGIAFSAMSNLIVQAVPPAQTGVASGMNANIRTIGGAVGAAIMGSIVTSQLLPSTDAHQPSYPAESGYTHGFLFLAVVTIVAVIAAILIPTATEDDLSEHHLHAELAIVPGGTLVED